MSSHTCPRCGVVTDSVLPSGLCVTCHGRADDTRPSAVVVADAPTPPFDPDAAGTFTFASPADTTLTPGGEVGAAPFGVLPPGGYQYGEVLGQGGMGVVYKAVRRSTGQTVAVKMLRPERCFPGLLRRFAREAQLLGRLNHPNVVRLDDFVPDRGDPYIVMEFIDGCTLADRLGDGKTLPPDAAARLVADAARGVQAAHAAGVIHRDLKPGNLLLTRDERVKVTDFGLGKFTDPGDGETLTGAGQLVGGTPGYMAPEQVDDTAAGCDARTDVWGLGACLYACLVGKPPFPTGTRNATRVLSDPFVPPRAVNRTVPPVLDAIVSKCLEKDPAKRYPTAAAVADDLDRYRRGESTVAKPLSWAARAWRRARTVHRGLVAAWAVAAITGVIALLATPRPSGPQSTFQPLVSGESKADALAALEAEYKTGRTVILVPEKGLPKWSEWVVGKTDIAESPTRDGSAYIQPIGTAAVKLFTPPAGSYEVTAELRHVSAQDVTDDSGSQVGVMLFQGRNHGPDGTSVESYTTVSYHDWGWGRPPNSQKVAVTGWHTFFSEAGRAAAPSTNALATSITTFTAELLPGKWRRVKAEITPTGCRLYWCDDAADPAAETKLVAAYTTRELNTHAAQHRRVIGLMPRELRMHPAPVPAAWNPNGGFGVWCANSGLCFRNVTVRLTPPEESP